MKQSIYKPTVFYIFLCIFFCNFLLSNPLSYPKIHKFIKSKHNLKINRAIDVIIPCHEKDVQKLDLAIDGIRKNGINVRHIIVISNRKLTDKAEWFPEQQFPFSKKDLALAMFNEDEKLACAYLKTPLCKIGWIYQQFLKLYAAFVIPDISSNILSLDADTVFFKPVSFIDDEGCALFNPGTEYHIPYFEHMKRLLPGFKKVFPQYSGISHHMLFQRDILENFFSTIQQIHHEEPWKAMCRCIDPKAACDSCISEYELYFNFAFTTSNKVKIRPLRWDNILNPKAIEQKRKEGFHYVSCHYHPENYS